jgi:hypothetical protein
VIWTVFETLLEHQGFRHLGLRKAMRRWLEIHVANARCVYARYGNPHGRSTTHRLWSGAPVTGPPGRDRTITDVCETTETELSHHGSTIRVSATATRRR